MLSGDGLVVRVRPRGGRLTGPEAQGIADLARRFGNGVIDLSSRANLQIRGVAEPAHGPLIEGLRALGLIDPSTEAEARRNILVTPFWAAGDGTLDLALRLSQALTAPGAPATPGKFGYAVDCGPGPVLGASSADIRIERAKGGGLIVRADGAPRGAAATPATAAGLALDLARWFLASGGAPSGRGRMAAHLARGARLPDSFTALTAQPGAAPAPAPGPLPGGVLVGLEFGQMQAKTLSLLAETGPLRLTPWRMILIEGTGRLPDHPALITRAEDPRLRVIACTGAPACPQAQGDTRQLARALAPHIPPGRTLHLSGCAKGCAHPGATPLTLTARPEGRYDLIADGRPADPPRHTGLTATDLAPPFLTEFFNAP